MKKDIEKYTDKHVVGRYGNKNYLTKALDNNGLESIEKYRKEISFYRNLFHKPYYPRKKQRYLLVTDIFKSYFGQKVLDVGTRDNTLSELLGRPCDIIDKNNKTLESWNWEKDSIPYESKSFDTVVCLDVLEHVDNFHNAFEDLLRVSKDRVIISLPNNWKKVFIEMLKGRSRTAGYGIPAEIPMDRHKWFFNSEDIENFIYYNSSESLGNYSVEKVIYHMPKTIFRLKIQYPILRLILPERHFKNLFVDGVFIVIKVN